MWKHSPNIRRDFEEPRKYHMHMDCSFPLGLLLVDTFVGPGAAIQRLG
jgi:hypothetical protein